MEEATIMTLFKALNLNIKTLNDKVESVEDKVDNISSQNLEFLDRFYKSENRVSRLDERVKTIERSADVESKPLQSVNVNVGNKSTLFHEITFRNLTIGGSLGLLVTIVGWYFGVGM